MDLHAIIDDTIEAVARARKAMAAGKSVQVQSADERDHMKAVATLWFQKHRREVAPSADAATLAAVDEPLKRVFDATAKAAARNTYVTSLKAARACRRSWSAGGMSASCA